MDMPGIPSQGWFETNPECAGTDCPCQTLGCIPAVHEGPGDCNAILIDGLTYHCTRPPHGDDEVHVDHYGDLENGRQAVVWGGE
jgi:hypothetical protein